MGTFAENLRTLRKEAGLSQLSLALELDLAQKSIDYFEHGTKVPSVATIVSIADYFHVSVDYLLGREVDRKI